jgi:hypothetical protein
MQRGRKGAKEPTMKLSDRKAKEAAIVARIRLARALRNETANNLRLFRNGAGTHRGFGVVVDAVRAIREYEAFAYEEIFAAHDAPSEGWKLVWDDTRRKLRNLLDRYNIDAAEYHARLRALTSARYVDKSGLSMYELQSEDKVRALCT